MALADRRGGVTALMREGLNFLRDDDYAMAEECYAVRVFWLWRPLVRPVE